jgi:hypothetical protein
MVEHKEESLPTVPLVPLGQEDLEGPNGADGTNGLTLETEPWQVDRLMAQMAKVIMDERTRLRRQMEEAVEAVRQQIYERGFQDGYAAAVRDLSNLTSSESGPALPKPSRTEARLHDDYKPRIPAAVTDEMVESSIRSVAPRAIGPTELLHIIKQANEQVVPFTTLRRSLARLTTRRIIQPVGDTKTWRWIGHTAQDASVVRPIRPAS